MTAQRIPELIATPADLDVWTMNRSESFDAMLREFKDAVEEERWHDCTTIAGMVGSLFGVVERDMPLIIDRARRPWVEEG